jgi:hypothetical protein
VAREDGERDEVVLKRPARTWVPVLIMVCFVCQENGLMPRYILPGSSLCLEEREHMNRFIGLTFYSRPHLLEP